MATYPLKNIAVGGDIYQIQAGTDLFDFYVRVDCDYRQITTSNIISIGVSKNWVQIPTNDIWSTLNTEAANNAQVQLSIAPNEYAPSGAEGCNLWVLNRYPYNASSASSQDFIFISEPYDKNGTQYITKVVITVNEYNQLSGVGESIALGGGGGGGGSNICLTLKTTSGGSMSFTQCVENTSFKLYDASTNTAKTFTEILAAYDAGIPIVIKDDSPAYSTINFVSGNQQWINFTYMTGPWSSTMYSLACGASGITFTINGRKQIF